MYDFFLSHNRQEKDFTRFLAEALRHRGVEVFFDEDCIRPGDDIVRELGRALERSTHIALILSPASVASRWVELEWASSLYADPANFSRRVIPVLTQACEIPFMLRRLKYIDARSLTAADVAAVLSNNTKNASAPVP